MNLVALPAYFFMWTKDSPPMKAIRSMPAIITAMNCCGIRPSLDVSMANSAGYTKNVNIRRNMTTIKELYLPNKPFSCSWPALSSTSFSSLDDCRPIFSTLFQRFLHANRAAVRIFVQRVEYIINIKKSYDKKEVTKWAAM